MEHADNSDPNCNMDTWNSPKSLEKGLEIGGGIETIKSEY